MFGDVASVPTSGVDGGDARPVTVDLRRDPPAPGSVCLMNSDCDAPLACAAGRCHAQCAETRDCANSRCVKVLLVPVCLLPQESTRCSLHSDCVGGLVCARDLRCRNECIEDRDCVRNQKCIQETCADLGEFDPSTNKLYPPFPADAGVSGDGGPG